MEVATDLGRAGHAGPGADRGITSVYERHRHPVLDTGWGGFL